MVILVEAVVVFMTIKLGFSSICLSCYDTIKSELFKLCNLNGLVCGRIIPPYMERVMFGVFEGIG